jgi:LysR family nitrogen assimilation transcriptional regulator
MNMKHDITIHQFRVFLKVAEFGSITRSANALFIPQPSVSRSLARIEAALGVKLIERYRSGVRLTAAGQAFHAHAGEAIRHFDLAAVAATQEQAEVSGEVRLAAPESFAGVVFRPLVKRFQERFPAARIRVMTSASAHIPSLIDNNIVDMGIIADTHSAPAMPTEPLCREAFYLIGPRDHAVTRQETVSLKRVATLPLYLNAMTGGFRARIDEAFNRQGLAMQVRAEIDANEPILDLILDEEGFTILPFSAIARNSRGQQLSSALIVAPEISRNLRLVITPSHPVSATCRHSVGLVHEVVRAYADIARWDTGAAGDSDQ